MINLFQAAIAQKNNARPPVWFMRQAGRYHSHYQGLKKRYSFIELCKIPEIACETTMGPIRDFDFDAAILFSDLLFPLDAMGMGLRYSPGPILEWHLTTVNDLKRLTGGPQLAQKLSFQADAIRLIRRELAPSKGLLGFVGGPATLFCYAVEGRHSGELNSARAGLTDGRYLGFLEKLLDLLAENMALQARAGADTIAVFDTCAGEFDLNTYRDIIVPSLRDLFLRFKRLCPETPITYYSKGTNSLYWKELEKLPIACLGVDWHQELSQVLREQYGKWAIQGNIDPEWLLLDGSELERRLRDVFSRVKTLPAEFRRGWICGLGHGVLQTTPEDNIRRFLTIQREML